MKICKNNNKISKISEIKTLNNYKLKLKIIYNQTKTKII